ncbi:MAG: DEAD/DEAH box helicase [Spirochaetales bacterium]|nr:DEAD/DEAH box helicase [Spirochaetales bacterium]
MIKSIGIDWPFLKLMVCFPMALERFHPLIQDWFTSKYKTPTDIQTRGWSEIASGSHVLMTAPTGSGKTLAAFLWSLNQLISGEWPGGTVRVLYISPLKALNNDVRRNLLEPLGELKEFFEARGEEFPEIRVQTRSGDTSSSERQKIMRRPPEILITTPESLNLMLTSGAARTILRGLSAVILDEIHGIAGNKRGVHLMSAVERLTLINGEFQRIGLSATVHPLSRAASLLGGSFPRRHEEEVPRPRPVRIIRSDIKKAYRLELLFPENGPGEESHWPAVVNSFVQKIRQNRSTLIFCNSRRQTEKVTRLINETAGETLAFAHHGSLSREIRYFVEQQMKKGALKAIVATSSLEMGIDIGTIDEVLLIQAPFSLSSAIQRIGRGGHNVGDVSRAAVYPMFGADLIECAVAGKAMLEGSIEELNIPENPQDVLAQVILSMACTEEWDLDELYLFITSVYHWHHLPRRHFDLVLEMLNGRYADTRIGELKPRLNVDRSRNTCAARDGAQRVLYLSGGTIPDRGYYELRGRDGSLIGELDEEFVWERSKGDFFTLGTQTWRIDDITDRSVEVTPAEAGGAMSPFWKADPNGRDFFYSRLILDFLREAEETLARNSKDGEERLRGILQADYHMDQSGAQALIDFLVRQRSQTESALPHANHLLIEHFNDPLNRTDCHQIILHTLWGGQVNYPYAEALAQAWENKEGYPLQVFCDDNAVILDLPHQFRVEDVLSLVNGDNLEDLLRQRLEATMFFGGRFRHNSSRALLLPRKSFKQRTPLWLTRLRSKKLLQAVSRYEDFPILTETWRSCLKDDFDLISLTDRLDEIREGRLVVTETVTRTPSPLSAGIIHDHTHQRMYEDDTPLGGPSHLKDDLIRGIVHESGLRPMIPDELAEEFAAKLQRTWPDYAPRTAEELLDWVEERIFLPQAEWESLLQAMERDLGTEEARAIRSELGDRLTFWEPEEAEETLILSQTYRKKYGSRGFLEEIEDILPRWLTFYGPLPTAYVLTGYPAPEGEIAAALEKLRESSLRESARGESAFLIVDRLTENAREEQLCTAENLEILFRLKRRRGRSDFSPLPVEQLPLFLAQHQGLTRAGSGKEDLQQVFEKLVSYGAKASLWETEIFPARMEPYYPGWLDTLFQESSLMWYGAGKEKIAFCFEGEQSLFIKRKPGGEGETLFPDRRGRFSFWDLKEQARLSSGELTEILWKECWAGRISNDRYSTVRTGINTKFKSETFKEMENASGGKIRRGGFNRWARSRTLEGRWFLTEGIKAEEDLIEKDERMREVIRQLFLRYGVLFRTLLEREAGHQNWAALFRTLRLMELAGECVSGRFFEGIRGMQFASWEALRTLNQPLDGEALYWMNCADPASLAGTKEEVLKGRYPSRLASNHMVFRGDRPLLFSRRNGRELEFFSEPEERESAEALGFFRTLLGRETNPLKAVRVETINGLPLSESPYAPVLKEAGFRDNFSCFIMNGLIR